MLFKKKMFNFWSWTKYFYFYYLNKKAALFQLDSDIKDYFAFLLNLSSTNQKNLEIKLQLQ